MHTHSLTHSCVLVLCDLFNLYCLSELVWGCSKYEFRNDINTKSCSRDVLFRSVRKSLGDQPYVDLRGKRCSPRRALQVTDTSRIWLQIVALAANGRGGHPSSEASSQMGD